MSSVTKNQLSLMKHTMSDGGRNWFGTSNKGRDCAALNDLVDKGFAVRRKAPSFWGDDWVFSLTKEGIDYLEASS